MPFNISAQVVLRVWKFSQANNVSSKFSSWTVLPGQNGRAYNIPGLGVLFRHFLKLFPS
jgi:hypothetical protein